MKKILNFSTTEKLANNSLATIKGGGNSNGNTNPIAIINGGDETDKRPKKPTVGETLGKANCII